MYRLEVRIRRRWKLGLHDYSLAEARARSAELAAKGIQARIIPCSKVFS